MMINYETIVIKYFKSLGYHIEKIAESDIASPDIFIYDSTSSYLVELKTKFPSDEEIKERNIALEYGKIHNVFEAITINNRLSGIIKKAIKQLESNYADSVYRLVWLHSTGHLAELRMQQFVSTLYGSESIITDIKPYDCYFFYNSEFFRFRDIFDGAIVSYNNYLSLLLNPLSPKIHRNYK